MKDGYKKTEVGFIPNEWEVKTIGELFEFKNGLNKEKEFFGKGTKIVNYVDVFRNRCLDNDVVQGLVEVSEKEKQLFNTQKGDVFFTRTSETVQEIGMTAVLLENINDLVYSGFVLRARPKSDDLHLLYKKYCFSDFHARKEIVSKSSYTTRALTSGTLLKDVLIKIPPIQEQQKIAEILSTVDSQIEDTDKLIKKTKELKKGLMQRLLTKGIGHKEFKRTEIGEIPVEWEVRQLGETCEFRQGFQIPRIEQITGVKNGYVRYLYITDFFSDEKKLFVRDSEKYYYIGRNDITIANTGNTSGKAFKGAEGVLSNNMFKIFNNNNILLTDYLWQYLKSNMYREQLYKYFNTAGQPHVGHKNMSQLLITLPNCLEQQKISEILSAVDGEIEEYENKKTKLQELKKGLMQQLLTGKVRVEI